MHLLLLLICLGESIVNVYLCTLQFYFLVHEILALPIQRVLFILRPASGQYILHSTPYARPTGSYSTGSVRHLFTAAEGGSTLREQGETVLLLCRKPYRVVYCPPARHKTKLTVQWIQLRVHVHTSWTITMLKVKVPEFTLTKITFIAENVLHLLQHIVNILLWNFQSLLQVLQHW